jgi:hypothetical protein
LFPPPRTIPGKSRHGRDGIQHVVLPRHNAGDLAAVAGLDIAGTLSPARYGRAIAVNGSGRAMAGR